MKFRTKTIIGIASIEIILLAILIWSNITNLRVINEQQLFDRAESTSSIFSKLIKDAVLASDLATLDEFTNELSQQPQVAYAVVVNTEGIVLSQYGQPPTLSNDNTIDSTFDEILDGTVDTHKEISESGQIFGHLYIGLSVTSYLKKLHDTKLGAYTIAFIEILFVGLFSFVLGTYLTKQIVSLINGIKKVGGGALGHQIKIFGNDEISNASREFNNMSLRLQNEEKLKNEFLSVVSHELRTPLTAIQGSLGLLIGEALGEKYSPQTMQLLTSANNNSQRLIHTVNDILDMHKLQAGEMQFNLEPCSIQELVNECIDENNGYAEKFGINLKLLNTNSEQYLNIDKFRIKQVMANLISNAVKFSPKGESVDVAIKEKNGVVRVSVSDKGDGIPDDFREHIFEKFRQVDSSDERSYSGTGLGLPICLQIIQQHNGVIDFISSPNNGTEFFFELPIADAKEARSA